MQQQNTLAAFAEFFDQLGVQDVEGLRRAHDIFAALEPEALAGLSDALDMVQQDPAQYEEFRRIMREDGGLGEDVLPESYDPSSMLVLNALTKSAMGPPQRQGFAMGGAVAGASTMSGPGLPGLMQQAQQPIYGTDTLTAHITPGEAHLLQARGGAGVINQQTGRPQFFLRSIGRALSGVAGSIGKALRTVAPIAISLGAAAVLGPAGFGLSPMMAGALGGGLTTLFTGGSPSDALRSAAFGGVAGGLMGGFGGQGAAEGVASGAGAAAEPVAAAPATGSTAAQQVLASAGAPAATTGGLPTMLPEFSGEALSGAAAAGSSPLSLAGAATRATTAGGLPEQLQGFSGAATAAAPAQPGMLDRVTGGARNVWENYLSPNRGMPTEQQIFDRAGELTNLARAREINLSGEAALRAATQELTPSMISRYGPLAATGIGAMALTGGFRDQDGGGGQIVADERARFDEFTPPPDGFSIFANGVPRYQQPMYEAPGMDRFQQPRMRAASGGIADVARVRMQSGGSFDPGAYLAANPDVRAAQEAAARGEAPARDMRYWSRYGDDSHRSPEHFAQVHYHYANLHSPHQVQRYYDELNRRSAAQAAAARPAPQSAMPAASSFQPASLPAARPLFPGADSGVPQTPSYVPPAYDVSASPYVSAGLGFGSTMPDVGGSYDDAVQRAQQYFSSMQPGGALIDPADAVMVPPMPTQWQPPQTAAQLPALLPEQEQRQLYAAGGSAGYRRRYG